MNLSEKNQQQQTLVRRDFTGGLNLTSVPEMIKDNELSECVNMELNKNTGALQTCCGTATIYKCPDDINIDYLFFDEINNCYLFVDASTRKVYQSRLIDMEGTVPFDRILVGRLTGHLSPMAVTWEEGMLIASGGRLQYWDGLTLTTIKCSFEEDALPYYWDKVTPTDYEDDTDYVFGDIVLHEDKYYKLTVDTYNKSEWDAESWVELTLHESFGFNKTYTRTDLLKYKDEFYICNTLSHTLSDSPSQCNGVFVKNGRVWIWYEYTLKCSGVGDERNWTDNSSDDSSSKWLNVGYKEGDYEVSYILGVCNLSSDIVIIKADGKVYRLKGDYPDWALVEVARGLRCINRHSYCAVQDGVFILSRSGLFYLQTTAAYGDVKPANIASNIGDLFYGLSSEDTKMHFIPTYNQIWITGLVHRSIIFDIDYKAFWLREFNSRVNHICMSKDTVLIARASHTVTRLMEGVYEDEKYSVNCIPIDWSFTVKSVTSFYDFLLKRVRITYIPLLDEFERADVITAEGRIEIDLPARKFKSAKIYGDKTPIYGDKRYLFPVKTHFATQWLTFRDRVVGMNAEGKSSAIILNQIESAIAEV